MELKKIAVVQFYTANVSYGKFAEEINKAYCDEKGYTYFCEKDNNKIQKALIDRAYTWYKPKLIAEVFNTYNPDYILFLDIDAIVCNFEYRIEEFIDDSYNVICTNDHGPSRLNAGVFIMKNSEWTKNLLNTWWQTGADLIGGGTPEAGYYKNALWHDQTCFGHLIDTLPDAPTNIKIVPNSILNGRVYKDKGAKNFIFHAFSYGWIKNRTIDACYYDLLNIIPPKNYTYMTLSEFAKRYPTDKDFTHKYYDSVYEKYFNPIKDDAKLICEIGIGGFSGAHGWIPGNSLKVFRDYFVNASILGLDIVRHENIADLDRITLDWLDQSKRDLVIEYAAKLQDYDLILDDGSHNVYDQQITLAHFLKSLKSGGIYVLEDLHSSIEVNIPEKTAIWGWGEPGFITPLQLLEHFKETGEIIADHLNEEEKLYLQENIASVEIFYLAPTSITSIIVKK